MRTRLTSTFLLASLAFFIPRAIFADDYDLSWFTIDGGGVTYSNGGDYEMDATIGQPDAGLMVAGDYDLYGGFWPGLNPICEATIGGECCLLADLNEDDQVDGLDIQGFVNCLLHTDGSNCDCADLDDSGAVTLSDVPPLVALLVRP